MMEFKKTTRINRSAAEVFDWHERPGAFQRLSPPWAKVSVESAQGGIRDGAEVRLKQKIGPFSTRWVIRHEGYEKGRNFTDRQVSGPFMSWLHHHRFEPVGEGVCELTDHITFELPMASLSDKLAGKRVLGELQRVFDYRHRVTRMDLETHPLPRMDRGRTVAITGASGLVGTSLRALLETAGHTVRALSRGSGAEIRWDPGAGSLDPAALEGVDGIIHLAGEPIAQRWTKSARHRILESRRKGTRLLAEAAASMKVPPRSFVSMSGINAYGANREEPLTEESQLGKGFLADVCREWEAATSPLEGTGIRPVIVRSGIVLSPAGGALGKMLPVFRVGLGGPIGRGQRWMSWIAIDDLAALLAEAVLDEKYRGVINGVAPHPVTNREFSKSLGQKLRRPVLAVAPPTALRLALGQMAEETVLGDLQVLPSRLEAVGFKFRFPRLPGALAHVLGAIDGDGEAAAR